MRVEDAVDRINQQIGNGWPKCKVVPFDLISQLCDAFWELERMPSVKILAEHLPVGTTAIRPGFVAWKRSKGFWQAESASSTTVVHLDELLRRLPQEIRGAPQTFLDPHNNGRYKDLTPKIVSYLARIPNASLRNAMSLFALSKTEDWPHRIYTIIATFVGMIRRLMAELSIEDVCSIKPDELLFAVYEGKLGRGLTEYQRSSLIGTWSIVRNALEDYATRLIPEQLDTVSRFFLQPVTDRRRLAKLSPRGHWDRKKVARVKAKTDVVHSQFHQLRFMARMRFNQAKRLHDAVLAAIDAVKSRREPIPFRFNYVESVPLSSGRSVKQKVHLILWDTTSMFDEAVKNGYGTGYAKRSSRRSGSGKFSRSSVQYEVEYCGVESLDPRIPSAPFWFLELFDHQVFTTLRDQEQARRREAFYRRWGYATTSVWNTPAGLLRFPPSVIREVTFFRNTCARMFLPWQGIYLACLFAQLIVRVQTVSGARLGEVQQIAQNPDCIKELVNVGPKATTRWLLRMAPKGSRERANYFIDEDTKNHLIEVVSALRAINSSRKLPLVRFHPTEKMPPDRYVLQWQRLLLIQNSLGALLRFFLHGLVVDMETGAGIHFTSHLLRHALATEMASLKVPTDILAAILHQRDTSVTEYYSRPTKAQVMQATETLFVERIDVAAEALRDPEHVGRMMVEAEGKIGALTEVLGGVCTIGNMCPAKFACIGCAGNAPDPGKRRQVELKRDWATAQMTWARRQKLLAEERQMKHLIQDCDLMLEEMSLISKARKDSAQLVQIKPFRQGQ